MSRNSILLFIMSCLIGVSALANTKSKKLIVRLEPGQTVLSLEEMGFRNIEPLVAELGIYAVEPSESAARTSGGLKNLAAQLREYQGIVYAQEDHPVTWRAKPNDKNFAQQWDMISDSKNYGVDALSAWQNYGTGGVDARGNDVVVAVVDGGVDVTHQDLAANIWVNKNEIPNNRIDDDKNGYIDDVNGWDAYTNTGKVSPDFHGTHVAGTVGAVGNNGVFGSGINWKVKIMAVGGSSSQTSIVLKAYGYILQQKKLWLQSGGAQGANVVATNSSFGVDYGNCKSPSYAVWNDIYNEMGKVGILHATATANSEIDVDARGDVPTGCDSPYLITVTNSQKDGSRSWGSAWGTKSIDLAAPGTDIYSTLPRNGWGLESGTSMSSPHVAGAIAYMHSVASKDFNNEYYADPGATVLHLKEAMLNTVTPMKAFAGKTVSGGILNLNGAAASISTY